jgi:NAD(P)-dependent dehydrogenase (short-subunit alcohol dehydrogenase family)
MSDTMAGRRVFITGGASGIGRATAELFAREGARVAIFDVNADAAQEAAQASGGIALVGDVSHEADVERAISDAARALGGLDGLVNSAGVSFRHDVRDAPIDKWRRVLDVNLTGVFLACHFALPFMERQATGTIVNVSSGSALRAVGGRSGYMAAKSGLISFTKSLAQEVAPRIRVNVLCPGPVDTPLFRGNLSDLSIIQKTGNALALKRVGAVDEMAQAIHFLSCDQSSFTTGAMLMADGGGKHAMM